jgi:hypothetical protein
MDLMTPKARLLGDLVLAALITVGSSLFGLALISQSGSSLKTAVVQDIDTLEEIALSNFQKDWVSTGMPEDEEELIEGEEICPSPSPSPSDSYSSSPTPSGSSAPQSTDGVTFNSSNEQERVLGEKLAIAPRPPYLTECITSFEGPIPNLYEKGAEVFSRCFCLCLE